MSRCVILENPKQLSRLEWDVWKRWLWRGVADGWHDWMYVRLPEPVRSFLFDALKERRFYWFQIRQHERRKGEYALFGTRDDIHLSRGGFEYGGSSNIGATWYLLAHWTMDDTPLAPEEEIRSSLKTEYSHELSRSFVSAVIAELWCFWIAMAVMFVGTFYLVNAIDGKVTTGALIFFVCVLGSFMVFANAFEVVRISRDRKEKRELLEFLADPSKLPIK